LEVEEQTAEYRMVNVSFRSEERQEAASSLDIILHSNDPLGGWLIPGQGLRAL
jgi:hypothetical protein